MGEPTEASLHSHSVQDFLLTSLRESFSLLPVFSPAGTTSSVIVHCDKLRWGGDYIFLESYCSYFDENHFKSFNFLFTWFLQLTASSDVLQNVKTSSVRSTVPNILIGHKTLKSPKMWLRLLFLVFDFQSNHTSPSDCILFTLRVSVYVCE